MENVQIKPNWIHLRDDFQAMAKAALAAANPVDAMRRSLTWTDPKLLIGDQPVTLPPNGRCFVVAAGKGSIGMTRALVQMLGERITAGVVAYPSYLPAPELPDSINTFAAGHPIPTDGSLKAVQAVAAMVQGDTIDRVQSSSLDLDEIWDSNDTNKLFQKLGDDWITGPTGTNVKNIVI